MARLTDYSLPNESEMADMAMDHAAEMAARSHETTRQLKEQIKMGMEDAAHQGGMGGGRGTMAGEVAMARRDMARAKASGGDVDSAGEVKGGEAMSAGTDKGSCSNDVGQGMKFSFGANPLGKPSNLSPAMKSRGM